MLIPNIGPYKFLTYSKEELINLSEADKEVRPFAVMVFLEDTRARTKHIYLTFEELNNFSVKDGEFNIDFFLEKNNEGQLISLLGGIFTTNYMDAFEKIYPHIQRILSLWCFKFLRPVSTYEIRIIDNKHKSVWGIPPTAPHNLSVINAPVITISNSSISSLVSIFRDGMNSQSISHRFLSYYKILEAYPSYGPFMETNNACKSKGIKIPRSVPRVSRELLRGAYKEEYHSEFINKKFTWCKEQLEEVRDLLAHPFLSHGYIDLDNVEVQSKISAYANLLERIAIDILREEFKLWAELSDNSDFKILAKSYSQ